MEFLFGQESLTTVQWTLRGILGFVYLMLVVKFMGQRSISQLGLLDFVLVMLLGNILAHPLSDSELEMRGPAVTVATVGIFYVLFLIGSLKSPKLRHFFSPSPMPLIKNGEILYKNLSKAKVTIDHLLSELRKQKIDDAKKVALSLWEPGGTISVFLFPQYEPVKKQDLNISPKAFEFARPVIKEGRMDLHELEVLGKNEQWLNQALRTQYNITPSQVLLATLDQQDQLKVFLYK